MGAMSEEPAGSRIALFGATGIVAGAAVWLLLSLVLGADSEELGAGLAPALGGIAIAAIATALVALHVVRRLTRRSAIVTARWSARAARASSA